MPLLLRSDAKPRRDGKGRYVHSVSPLVRWQCVLLSDASGGVDRPSAAAIMHRLCGRQWSRACVVVFGDDEPAVGSVHAPFRGQGVQARELLYLLHGQGAFVPKPHLSSLALSHSLSLSPFHSSLKYYSIVAPWRLLDPKRTRKDRRTWKASIHSPWHRWIRHLVRHESLRVVVDAQLRVLPRECDGLRDGGRHRGREQETCVHELLDHRCGTQHLPGLTRLQQEFG